MLIICLISYQYIQFVNYNIMSTEAVIGLMDSAYFVSKNQLLKWINQTLQIDLVFIEDLGSGSIYCQLIDAYYKQVVPMTKINWHAKFQYQFMNNLKIFQQSLERLGISKKIDVNKLSKARSQDNLEMIQWLKRYLQMTATKIVPYDPIARRNGEQFYSHHSTKNSFINRPGKQSLNSTMTSISARKQLGNGQQNPKNDRIQKIKKILEGGQDANTKIELISQVVYGNMKKALFNKHFNTHHEKIQEQLP